MTGPDGAALIAAERLRQITGEGWTASHDDHHDSGQLARAGACYALHASGVRQLSTRRVGHGWPWPWTGADFKPGDPVRTLVKAGALIAAEIDRLLREERRTCGEDSTMTSVIPAVPDAAYTDADRALGGFGLALTAGVRVAIDAAATAIRADERERLLGNGPRCCGLHGRNCEPPGELCCGDCTEADHPGHQRLGPCSNPDLSPSSLDEARKIAAAVAAERERLRLAVLGCLTCGRVHQRRELPSGDGWPESTRAAQGDGHPYYARYLCRGQDLEELLGDTP